MKRMIARKQVRKDVLAIVDNITTENYIFPADIMKTLQTNQRACENFKKYSAPYQRIRIAYIDSARIRPEEFKKRLNNFLKLTEQNKQFGFGIESYF
jgi:cyclopropane fatty-acyl-phospholipid synthase-like methyltransferase